MKRTLNIDLNRVEGDLEFQLELTGERVTEARCIGTLYRGFEQILKGRAPRDAMVLTPRVCGICGTAHLYSAVLALEQIWQVPVPPNATRIRNLCLMAEGVQNDVRQTFLFFTVDFCHSRYQSDPLFPDIHAAFEPFKGSIHLATLEMSKHALEIVALFGGQWPHSSYMLPGGVTAPADSKRLVDTLDIIDTMTRWYEEVVIGCSLETWLNLKTADDLWAWLEQPAHAQSGIGLLTRFARAQGLHKLGWGTPHMFSYGAYHDPENWQPPYADPQYLVKPGFYNAQQRQVEAFDQGQIEEHVRHSWFKPYAGGKHPWMGETIPDFQPESDRYTWAKAPRYGQHVVQTGPLAELLIDGEPLINSLHAQEEGNAWLRQFARIRRTAYTLGYMRNTVRELMANLKEPHILHTKVTEQDGDGYGLVAAARGGLGHWVKVRNGVIDSYQIITPTAWNASPRDSEGMPGHWEQSLVGIEIQDPDDPLEIAHVIRSHDPCLVCTVHMLDTGKKITYRP